MEVRTLGSTGIVTPALGAGCWAIGGAAENLGLPMGWATASTDESLAGLFAAHDAGVRLFDTADVYGLGNSERLIGQMVASVSRADLVLTSKVGYFAGTSEHAYSLINLRHQLEQTLENLGTDHLDIYFFHNNNFGPNDEYLDPALDWMGGLRKQGVVKHIGMRAPHRYALDRAQGRIVEDKYARFRFLAQRVQPEVLAVRDNLLSPAPRRNSIYEWASEHGCGVLVNKPLAQGLLTGKHRTGATFGPGDHRLRKAWFREPHLSVINEAVDLIRQRVGTDPLRLINLAIWSCLVQYDSAVALTGFTSPQQVLQNVAALDLGRPDDVLLQAARQIMADTQARLDSIGDVFIAADQEPAT